VSGPAANREFWRTWFAIPLVLTTLAFGVAKTDGPAPETLTLNRGQNSRHA
jgi:hypothetical protein